MEQNSPHSHVQEEQFPLVLRPFDCFKSLVWWRNAAILSAAFAPSCAVPAGLWLVVLALFIFPLYFVIKTLNGTVDVSKLIQTGVIYIVCMLIAVPLFFWSIGAWLVRLTAYCNAFVSFSENALTSTNLNSRDARERLKDALKIVAERKVFLAKFWSTLTAILIVPCIFLVIAMCVLAAASPGVLGPAQVQFPLWAMVLTHFFFWISFALLTIVSFVGLCISASASVNPVQHAKISMQISVQKFFPLLILSALSVLIATLITSPVELFRSIQTRDVFAININGWSVVEEIWRAISSTIVLTLTVAPICEYLRGSLSSEEP
ncbi:MAG TPA: hypothetical protein V6C76_08750 [Drouetiella sp.]